MLTFASAFASNFNIVSMVMLKLMKKMGTEPIFCVCVFFAIDAIIFENASADFDAIRL